MLIHIDGFDQHQGQAGTQLLGSLTASGYAISQGLAMATGRHASTHALELQPSPGAAGAAWSRRTNSIKSALNGVASDSAGRWIAVGDSGVAATSTDTVTWGTLVMGVSVTLNDICYTDGRWVAVGALGTILVSDDQGANWAPRTQSLSSATLNAVAAGGGKLVAVGANGSAGCILVSEDKGDTWAVVTANAGTQPNLSVAFGNGTWMVGGMVGGLRKSTNGGVWTTLTSGVSTPIYGIAHGGDYWLIPSGRTVRQSANDGGTWVDVATLLGGSSDDFQKVAHAAGRWVIAGARGGLMTSDNRIDWMTRPLTGTTISNTVSAIGISAGAASGMVVVGNLIGTGPAATALLFASLSPPTTISRTIISTASRVVVGFAHRATSRGRILTIENLMDLEWPASLSILGTDSTAIPIRNAWYYYELVIDKTAKTVSLFVNDTADIVVPLPDHVATMSQFKFTWMAENGAVARVDDLYLLDSATADGASLIDRLRPIRIPLRLPDADVDVNWEGSTPGDHHTLVGLLPPSESTFVRSAEPGAQELFKSSTPLPPSASVVLAVGVMALARKSDLDNRQLGLAVGPAGPTQREVIDTTLSINPEYSFAIFENGPSGNPWTPASVLATPFGVIVRP